MVRVLQILRQILETLIPNEPQIQTTHTGHANQFNNTTNSHKYLLNAITTNFQPMQVNLLNKMFISQRLSKFKYTNLRDFIITGEFEFGKSTHIAGDELGEFEDALVSDGLVLDVEAEFVGGEECVPELGEVLVV